MNKTKVIFMGTPVFACSILQTLIDSEFEVVLVVSQPDKKVGRKQVLTATPVKQLAIDNNIKCLQPSKINDVEDELSKYEADLIVTCAYGQLICDEILNRPKYGSINVHASLLPFLRGGAPIHTAIINGHSESGISIMRMVKKMDAGAVMRQIKVKIEENDTMSMLHDKLMDAGASIIIDSIKDIIDDKAVFVEQDHDKATYAYNISKDDEKVDFNKHINDVYNQMRGLIKVPCSYALICDRKIKFHSVEKILCDNKENTKLLMMMNNNLVIQLKDGYIKINEIQMEGKAKMNFKEFVNGAGRNLLNNSFGE